MAPIPEVGLTVSAKDRVEKVQHTIWLDPKISERLRMNAAKERIPMSTVVEALLKEKYRRKRKQKADGAA